VRERERERERELYSVGGARQEGEGWRQVEREKERGRKNRDWENRIRALPNRKTNAVPFYEKNGNGTCERKWTRFAMQIETTHREGSESGTIHDQRRKRKITINSNLDKLN
jgi:hypothetical protein